MVKSLPAMQEVQVQSLVGEDPFPGGQGSFSFPKNTESLRMGCIPQTVFKNEVGCGTVISLVT